MPGVVTSVLPSIQFQHNSPGKEEEVNDKTREEILSLIAHHVTAVNYIYRDTKFDGRSEHRNIKFEVQRIKARDFFFIRKNICFTKFNSRKNLFFNFFFPHFIPRTLTYFT